MLTQSAQQLAAAIRLKSHSSQDAIKATFETIEAVNPAINAIVQSDYEQALNQAKLLDEMQAKGRLKGPLHGVPFTVKDVYHTRGMVTTLGTMGLKNHVSDHDATMIKRLKDAGAILIGKTNVPELCTAAETDNLVYGTTNNPYDLARTPGGSSGGEAAAIAACCTSFGIGSDLGGSLRIPAHYCGITSLRPTIGRVACSRDFKGSRSIGIRTGGEALLACDGPMARYTEDLLPLLRVISGPDGIDPHVSEVPLRDVTEVSLKGLKIAFFTDNRLYKPTADISNAVNQSARFLMNHVQEVTEVPVPFMQNALELIIELMNAMQHTKSVEAALMSFGTKQPTELLLKFMERVATESKAKPEFSAVWDRWDYYRSALTQCLFPYDAIIGPVLPFTATEHHHSLWDDDLFPALSYCIGFSLHRLPIATVPVGQDEKGLPIGIQIVTKPWREDVAVAIAQSLEEEFGGWVAPSLSRVKQTSTVSGY